MYEKNPLRDKMLWVSYSLPYKWQNTRATKHLKYVSKRNIELVTVIPLWLWRPWTRMHSSSSRGRISSIETKPHSWWQTENWPRLLHIGMYGHWYNLTYTCQHTNRRQLFQSFWSRGMSLFHSCSTQVIDLVKPFGVPRMVQWWNLEPWTLSVRDCPIFGYCGGYELRDLG